MSASEATHALLLSEVEADAARIGGLVEIVRAAPTAVRGPVALATRGGRVFASADLEASEPLESAALVTQYRWRLGATNALPAAFDLSSRAVGPLWARLQLPERAVVAGRKDASELETFSAPPAGGAAIAPAADAALTEEAASSAADDAIDAEHAATLERPDASQADASPSLSQSPAAEADSLDEPDLPALDAAAVEAEPAVEWEVGDDEAEQDADELELSDEIEGAAAAATDDASIQVQQEQPAFPPAAGLVASEELEAPAKAEPDDPHRALIEAARERAQAFVPRSFISEDAARMRLIELREREIKQTFGDAKSTAGVLRKTLLDRLIDEAIETRDDFVRQIPREVRLATDQDQIDAYLDVILAILAKIR